MSLISRKERLTRDLEVDTRSATRDLPGLLEQLRSEDAVERRYAALDLRGKEDAVGPLLARLGIETEPVVIDALFDTLIETPGAEVLPGLVALLRSEQPSVRNGACEALVCIGAPAVAHLERVARDPDVDVRQFVVQLLGQIRGAESRGLLEELAHEEADVNVVGGIVEQLVGTGDSAVIPTLEAVKARFPGHDFITFVVDHAVRTIRAAHGS